ncbi:hypothetical protein [Roseiconus lacunae]|uniref:Uncharacterized protein n=1 Tax=Roseiconus lacunae TaxID=2605694 RepID=A0ABT7PRC5_9BACT|nr:hypothetical protein [Roseiconus lacunae]MDM4019053.1 hypothetical protein [Roseiconus lacunae]
MSHIDLVWLHALVIGVPAIATTILVPITRHVRRRTLWRHNSRSV